MVVHAVFAGEPIEPRVIMLESTSENMVILFQYFRGYFFIRVERMPGSGASR
jgi:hypothetical protein